MGDQAYAHTLKDRPPADWHPLAMHLEDTAKRAEEFASAFGAGGWGRLAGLWHDLGKYSEGFQGYLRKASGQEVDPHLPDVIGRVDHSTAGARHAAGPGRSPLGRLLAYVIAGHHAGLPDGEVGESSLRMRLEREPKLSERILKAPREILDEALPPPPKLRMAVGAPRQGFSLAFFTRMIFSCLVDADFLDTEAFMSPGKSGLRPDPASISELAARVDRHLLEKQSRAADTPVNRHRRRVLEACRAQASESPGFFSLNVPTGGGKTLSSLAFALAHASSHGMKRVIYAIPFTSIIEQTADVFRKALDDLAGEVLEHHSSLDPDDPQSQDIRSRLAAENFDATLVVTTNVQLFESLFACRTSRCRKLHRLAKSVIILDEAQALPPRLLAPTLAALEELVNNYGATVVLCTATQPAIEHREAFPIGLIGVRPIIDDPGELHGALRRTSVEQLGTLSNEDLADRIRGDRQALCIVNSRRHAADIFRALGDSGVFHLSASMCAAHRSEVVADIRKRLEDGKPCRVISTQVIEAGVDVDFPTVYRASAGLDSIAQAAGRCNREGKLLGPDGQGCLGRVYLFDYDAKTYPTDPTITKAAARFREVAPDHQADLLAPEAIEKFFRLHYWQVGGQDGEGWDRGADGRRISECFSTDTKILLQAQFREANDAYRLIDDAQTPILVPYGDRGQKLIKRLEQLPDAPEPKLLRAFDREAQRYTVGVYAGSLRKLLENGVLLELHGRIYLGNSGAYDGRMGLTFEAIGLNSHDLIL